MAVYLSVPGEVFDGVLLCAVLFSHEMSWMRSRTELRQFLRIFLPNLPLEKRPAAPLSKTFSALDTDGDCEDLKTIH